MAPASDWMPPFGGKSGSVRNEPAIVLRFTGASTMPYCVQKSGRHLPRSPWQNQRLNPLQLKSLGSLSSGECVKIGPNLVYAARRIT